MVIVRIGLLVAVVAGALAAGGALREMRRSSELSYESTALGSPAAPLVTGIERTPIDASTDRVSRPTGGWSLDAPRGWTARPDGIRGGDLYSFEPAGAPLSGNAPGIGETRVRVQLDANYEKRGADAFMPPIRPPDISRTEATTIAGLPARLVVGRAYSPAPFDVLHAWWYIVPPALPDHVLVLDVWPADPDGFARAETIARSLRLFAPASLAPPRMTRAEALEWAGQSGAAVRTEAIEAKLILWRDFILAQDQGPSSPRVVGGEPDRWYWVVLIRGEIVPYAKGAPPGPGQTPAPPPTPGPGWAYDFIDGVTDERGGPSARGLASPPTWWDRLPDRPGRSVP